MFERYAGDDNNGIFARIETQVLPFFSNTCVVNGIDVIQTMSGTAR